MITLLLVSAIGLWGCGISCLLLRYCNREVQVNIGPHLLSARGWLQAKLSALPGQFKGTGLSDRMIILTHELIAIGAVLLSLLLHNVFLLIPAVFLMRETFLIVAAFLKRKRRGRENAAFERLLRTFLACYHQTQNKRDALSRLQLGGVFGRQTDKLFRNLGVGDDTTQYKLFAAAFPGNPHVHLFAQILIFHNNVGGDLKTPIGKLLQDVMTDRMDEQRNQTETASTLTIVLFINALVIGMFIYNMLTNPAIAAIMMGSLQGQIMVGIATIICGISLQSARKISER